MPDNRLTTLNAVHLSETTKDWAEALNNNFAELDERKTDIGDTSTLVHDGSYVHTDNNYTTAEKNKLAGVATGAQVNVLEGVKVNGTALTPTNKVVDVTVPTKVSDLTNDEGYTKVEASSANGKIKIDGTETTVYTLPADVLHTGDADPAGTATSAVSTHNSSGSAHNDIRTLVSTAQSTADTAKSIAEGRDKAQSYASYSAMVTALNAEASATAKVGDNVYVETVDVPDFWVSKVNSSKTTYTYTTDAAIISAIATNGYIDIGWYRLAQLESTKVDLSGYVPTSRKVAGKALTSDITLAASDVGALAYSTKYGKSLAVSGTSVSLKDQDGTVLSTITTQDTTYSSLEAASGGTDVSLVTTGEKYNWNGAVSSLANKMDKANPTGTGNIKVGDTLSITAGMNAASFGYNNTTSTGGTYSLTAGRDNQVKGSSSHALGSNLKASGVCQAVIGKYNIEDTNNTYAEIVGNGGVNARSNARTLDWNGNEVLAGNITLGNHTTIANNSNSDITITLPSSAGTLATETYVDNAIAAVDQKTVLSFDATGWTAGNDGYYTKSIATTKYPINCFNSNNKVVMATLGVTKSGTAVTAITIESDEPFAGYVVAL